MLTLFRNLFAPPRHLILLVIAAWLGLSLAEARADRHGLARDQLNNLTFYAILTYIIGGRISFILQNIPAFIKSPPGLISINPDLFDPLGAAVFAFMVALIYCQRHDVPMWKGLDALTPFFASLTIGLGLSHLAAGTAFGRETQAWWGISMWNARRHPTQIYEIIAAGLTLTLLWLKRYDPRPGVFFLTFCALTAASQLFIQAFRGDSTFVLYGMRQGQVIAWAALLLCFILLEVQLQKKARQTK